LKRKDVASTFSLGKDDGMVTDNQVRRLMMLEKTEKTHGLAAARAGMDEKTADE
jgi:hypothetical protein